MPPEQPTDTATTSPTFLSQYKKVIWSLGIVAGIAVIGGVGLVIAALPKTGWLSFLAPTPVSLPHIEVVDENLELLPGTNNKYKYSVMLSVTSDEPQRRLFVEPKVGLGFPQKTGTTELETPWLFSMGDAQVEKVGNGYTVTAQMDLTSSVGQAVIVDMLNNGELANKEIALYVFLNTGNDPIQQKLTTRVLAQNQEWSTILQQVYLSSL
ncbi:MAG TPA: hypothetical protein VD999_02060 [Vitreimonas sp.]|nr:hypothetical protein [Vitreimonas sp.]